jgi:CPA2 family monovalent cation:H+ antiporter-2
VARRKSEELFVLNLLLVTLGLAWLTEHAGLSLALGAFVAGILIAETEFKHQVETDIRPFHDVLLGLFFITIGMKLDASEVLRDWALVLLLTVVPVLFKFVVIAALARAFGAAPGVALRTGWRRPASSVWSCSPWRRSRGWCRPGCKARCSRAWCSRCSRRR